jgi:type 2 lantibiotic biosynthesis protein LanM
LDVAAGVAGRAWSVDAYTALERDLLERLSHEAAQTLALKFSIFRMARESALDRLVNAARVKAPTRLYRDFVLGLLTSGLVPLYEEYPVLARLLATRLDAWVEAVSEMMRRLTEDAPALAQTFADGRMFGPVSEVAPFLSDPHNGGRGVARLTFAGGLTVVYKPRDLGLEEAFFRLLAWLDERGAPGGFRRLRVLPRCGHGWMEHADRSPCRDAEDARAFYRRGGRLLCVVHLLNGTDCHDENVVAVGGHPLVVDAETFLHPRPKRTLRDREGGDARLRAFEIIGRSVVATGLLPTWEAGAESDVYDIGGLTAGGQATSIPHVLEWDDVNTDAIVMRRRAVSVAPADTRPFEGEDPLAPQERTEAVLEGFKEMYIFLLRQREGLLARGGPLDAFRDRPVRFIFRDTKVYASLLERLLAPEYLRDGADRSIEIEALSRAFLLLVDDDSDALRPLLFAEVQAVEQGDVPRFMTWSDRDQVVLAPERRLNACFSATGLTVVHERLAGLSEDDLRGQLDFIRMALFPQNPDGVAGLAFVDFVRAEAEGEIGAVVDVVGDALVARAVSIGEELSSRCIPGDDGSVTWLQVQMVNAQRLDAVTILDDSLYEGACGVALFLAALARVTNRCEFRNLALAAVQPLRHS